MNFILIIWLFYIILFRLQLLFYLLSSLIALRCCLFYFFNCLSLIIARCENFSYWSYEHGYDEGAPDGIDHRDKTTENWNGGDITIAHGCHCYYHVPNWCEIRVKNFLSWVIVSNSFENPEKVGQPHDRDDGCEENCDARPLLEKGLETEGCTRLHIVLSTDPLRGQLCKQVQIQ